MGMITVSDRYTDYIKDISGGEISHIVKVNTPRPESGEHNENMPWHQLVMETGQAYAAFRIYMDMGHQRSQRGVSEVIYGMDEVSDQVKQWSVKYEWVRRAEAWDRFIAETHISNMEKIVVETEQFAMRHILPVTVRLKKVALGEETVKREELAAMNSYLDRFGIPKQRANPPIVNNQFNVTYPSLPGETTEPFKEVEDAEYEVLEDMAQKYIPDKLKNK